MARARSSMEWYAIMKRTIRRSILGLVALLAAAIAGFGLGWARPVWIPTWARVHLDGQPSGPLSPDDPTRFLGRAEPGERAVSAHEQAGARVRTDAAGDHRQPLPMVRLASAEIARRIGIEAAPATEEKHAHRLSANAETAYDTRRYATVSPRVAGFLREVRADLGQTVRRGEVLAVVDSAEISAAKTQYLTARATVTLAQATYERTKSLARTGQMAAKTELESLTALNQAQAAARDAEQRLRNLGLDDAEMARVSGSNDTTSLLNVVAPIDGTVVLLRAVQGEAVQPTAQLFAIADTSRMWLWIDVYESDIGQVALGQPVHFTISGTEAPAFAGKVTWLGTEVHPTTRTTRIRAELANPDGRLRANQFGKAEIQIGAEHTAVVVPKAAVQRLDGADLVFLPQGESSYRPQQVVTRPMERGDVLEITRGLKPGQRIVTAGAYRLKSEITKDAIVEE
ncbi:MAG: efflux RND transporter periplasmic adaptor subunit [Isosphaeraceae bacterium]|nr:efflux RND transporter periplasmic adaptor subunit [Isosphaeraceae bacterium]